MRFCLFVCVLTLALGQVRSQGGDPPATPPGDIAAVEKKISELERQLAVLREEVQHLRRQALPKDQATAEKTESSVSWGKAAKGLQAGLRYSSSTCALGEQLSVEVFVCNISADMIPVSYVEPSAFLGHLTEDNQLILSPVHSGNGFETTRDLAPGQELNFGIALLLLPPHPAVSPARPWLEIATGKYRVSAPHVLMRRDGSRTDLGTGYMDLEVIQVPAKKP